MNGRSIGAVGERLVVDALVRSLTPDSYVFALEAEVWVSDGGPIRCYFDGRTPDGNTGVVLMAGNRLTLASLYEIAAFRYVQRTGGAAGALEVVYRK